MVTEFDAVLVVGFGGPERPEDVEPFLEQVTGGRGIPRTRLAEVGAHYAHFGGASPINSHCRAIRSALAKQLAEAGYELPVYWGNRNWHPFLSEAIGEMRRDGVTKALAFVTSPYSSYSSCRQYLNDIGRAKAEVGAEDLEVYKIRQYFDHPGFIEPFVRSTREALAELSSPKHSPYPTPSSKKMADASAMDAHPEDEETTCTPTSQEEANANAADSQREKGEMPPLHLAIDLADASDADLPALIFTAHSIPTVMADACDYEMQLRAAMDLIADEASPRSVRHLVWQSRSGPPSVPWLEPDINDHLAYLASEGHRAAAIVPIGFVSDNIEVLWDLDNEAAATADKLGLTITRATTPATTPDPQFIAMIVSLIEERLGVGSRQALSNLPERPLECAPTCCESNTSPA